MGKFSRHCNKHGILWANFVGVILGIGLGFGLRYVSPEEYVVFWIGLPGNLLLSFLEMVIVPISVSSIIVGASSVSLESHKVVISVLLTFVTLTNILCTSIGLSLGAMLGTLNVGINSLGEHRRLGNRSAVIFADIFRNVVPRSLIRATFNSARTVISEEGLNSYSLSNSQIIYTNVPNMMGLVCMSLLIGVVAAYKRRETVVLIDFFKGVMSIGFTLMAIATWISPLCLCSLTCVSILEIEDVTGVFLQLIAFASLQIGANVIYQTIVLPILVLVGNGISQSLHFRSQLNPIKIMKASLRSWLITFATASPSIAMPDIYRVCKVLGVNEDIINAGVPLAFTMTTSGCGVYVSMASLFLAEASQITLSTVEILTIGLIIVTSTLSFGTVPSGSIVGLLLVTNSMGIPTSHLGLLIAVEWIVDRVRSTTTVITTVVCVYITDRITAGKLLNKDTEADIFADEESPWGVGITQISRL